MDTVTAAQTLTIIVVTICIQKSLLLSVMQLHRIDASQYFHVPTYRGFQSVELLILEEEEHQTETEVVVLELRLFLSLLELFATPKLPIEIL
jgi:hypothetical protein